MPEDFQMSDKSPIVFDEALSKLMQDAIRTYGIENQHMMMIEEMAELSLSICKVRRMLDENKPVCEIYAYVETHLIQEIVDVRIVIEQLVLTYISDTKVFDYKINRLRERIDAVKRNTESAGAVI